VGIGGRLLMRWSLGARSSRNILICTCFGIAHHMRWHASSYTQWAELRLPRDRASFQYSPSVHLSCLGAMTALLNSGNSYEFHPSGSCCRTSMSAESN